MKRAAIVLLLALAACSGGEGGQANRAATSTTSVVTPEQKFRSDIAQQLTVTGSETDHQDSLDAALKAAQTVCDALNAAAEGPADLATSVLDLHLTKTPTGKTVEGFDSEIVAVIVSVGAQDLCPDQQQVVGAYLDAHNLTP